MYSIPCCLSPGVDLGHITWLPFLILTMLGSPMFGDSPMKMESRTSQLCFRERPSLASDDLYVRKVVALQSFQVFCLMFLKAVSSWTMLRPGGESGSRGRSLGSQRSVPPPGLKSWSSISSCPN